MRRTSITTVWKSSLLLWWRGKNVSPNRPCLEFHGIACLSASSQFPVPHYRAGVFTVSSLAGGPIIITMLKEGINGSDKHGQATILVDTSPHVYSGSMGADTRTAVLESGIAIFQPRHHKVCIEAEKKRTFLPIRELSGLRCTAPDRSCCGSV